MYEHITGRQYFSFEYPQDWEIEEDQVSKGDELADGIPDFEMYIYMDRDNVSLLIIFQNFLNFLIILNFFTIRNT